MIILGIDPGLNGGLALVGRESSGQIRLFDVSDIPTVGEKAKRRVDVPKTMTFMRKIMPQHAIIERAQAFADQGASSGFIYGRAVGALEAVVAGLMIPLTIVEPTAWKKACGLLKRDKEDSRQRALQLFPGAVGLERKMDHGRAEAALMAWYGLMLLRGKMAA